MSGAIIQKIIEIATGKKAKIFWAFIVGTFIIFLVLYPYIDANFLIYNRIDKRIEILDKITALDTEKIAANEYLQKEYDSIIEEITTAQDKSIGNITKNVDTVREQKIKFLSGGILLWFVSVFVLFGKNKNVKGNFIKRFINRVLSTLLCVGLGYILALAGKKIPTFMNVWVNAIGFPCLQIAFIGLLVYGTQSNKS